MEKRTGGMKRTRKRKRVEREKTCLHKGVFAPNVFYFSLSFFSSKKPSDFFFPFRQTNSKRKQTQTLSPLLFRTTTPRQAEKYSRTLRKYLNMNRERSMEDALADYNALVAFIDGGNRHRK